MGLARELRLTVLALDAARAQLTAPDHSRVEELYLRLTWIFNVKTEFFERKAYASLSHEANKAMNLNAYISLMGGRWQREVTDGNVVLRRRGAEFPGSADDLVIPDTTYLLTLDADSLLLRDYCLRLVYFLESAGNDRVAVAQTPYSSFRGALTGLSESPGPARTSSTSSIRA